MIVASVFSTKGGVGKSTIVSNLAVTAALSGDKVGVIDLDPQGSLLSWRGLRPTDNVAVKACSPSELTRLIERERSRRVLDLILIDAPAGAGPIGSAAIVAGDVVLAPVRPAAFDLAALSQTFEMIRQLRKRFGVVINAAPPIREGLEAPLVRQTRQKLAEVGARLWKGQITSRLALVYASSAGVGVAEIEPKGPSAVEYQRLWRAVRHEVDDLRMSA